MWRLLTGLIWLTSFAILPFHANGFWAPKEAVWLIGSFLLASSPWWNPPTTRPGLQNRALGWFVMWAMLSFGFFVLWPQVSQQQTLEPIVQLPWNYFAIFPTMLLLGSVLAADAMIRHTDASVRWQRIALHLITIACLLSIWAWAQWLKLDPFEFATRAGGYRLNDHSPITVLGNQTLTGNFLAIIAPLCLMFQAKRYRIASYLLIASAVILCASASSLAALVVASMGVFVLQRKWLMSSLLMGLMGIGIWWTLAQGTLLAFLNPQGRLEVWTSAWTFAQMHVPNLWIGFGAGAVAALTTQGHWNYGFLHSEPIQIAFEYGLIGFTLALMAVWVFARQCWRGPRHAAISGWYGAAIAYAIICLVNFPFRIGSLLMLGVVIWAALESYTQEGTHA